MIDFDTKLAELEGDDYFTIATKKAGDIMRIGKQHLKFYGSLKDAKEWFYRVINRAYQHKTDIDEWGAVAGFGIGDVKFEHDSTIDQLVVAYKERF